MKRKSSLYECIQNYMIINFQQKVTPFILFLLPKEIFKTLCHIKPILAILLMNLLEFLIRTQILDLNGTGFKNHLTTFLGPLSYQRNLK